jgi:hypothetical protein
MQEGDNPTMADNVKYFINYQTNWMFFRYFMWSYSGKQNDLEGFGNVRDGNWITGIPFIDNFRLGDQSKMPDSIHTNNKSYNRLFLLPFILGIIGLVFQLMRGRSASAGRSTSVPEAMATTRRFSLCNHTGAHSFCGVDAMCSPTAAAMRTPIDETVSTVATASGSKDWVGTFGSAHQTLTTAAATLRE